MFRIAAAVALSPLLGGTLAIIPEFAARYADAFGFVAGGTGAALAAWSACEIILESFRTSRRRVYSRATGRESTARRIALKRGNVR